MFKSVEYTGFDGHPGMRQVAERAAALLPAEIGSMREYVTVEWGCHPETPPAIELDITLELPAGRGRATCLIPVSEFGDDVTLSDRIRSVWNRVLGDYLEKRKPAWDALIREPLEV